MVSENKQIKEPKYSIIIPTYNGLQYIPTCIETIISQDYSDYELIISDDHSSDGTREFLETLNHPNIRTIFPPKSLSMTEHWEWALSHAHGEWQIFVGQDDGLQSYFFELAEKLTTEAKKKKLRTIASKRAYFFWPGCEARYGDIAIQYTASKKTQIKNFRFQSLLALLGIKTYFELPQMYTTSIFQRSIIIEARKKQGGKIFITHPQDANLAAIGCSLENKFLWSEIPLGWVGSSPKSAGMAIRVKPELDESSTNIDIQSLKVDYLSRIKNSNLNCHPLTGDFELGSLSIYYWGALLQSKQLIPIWITKVITSKAFKSVLFASVLLNSDFSNKVSNEELLKLHKKVVYINNCNLGLVRLISYLLIPVNLISKVKRKINSIFLKNSFSYSINWKEDKKITMESGNKIISEGMNINKISI